MQRTEPGLNITQLEVAGTASGRAAPRAHTSGAKEKVYQTIVDLCNVHRKASRQMIADVCSLKMSIVDDHTRTLIDDNRIRRLYDGVYEPVIEYPADRAISVSEIPDGMVNYEIGDNVVLMTPSEARRTGRMFEGYARQGRELGVEQDERSLQSTIERLLRENRESTKQVEKLAAQVARMQLGQSDLFAVEQSTTI